MAEPRVVGECGRISISRDKNEENENEPGKSLNQLSETK
jgi:hypothetical protein